MLYVATSDGQLSDCTSEELWSHSQSLILNLPLLSLFFKGIMGDLHPRHEYDFQQYNGKLWFVGITTQLPLRYHLRRESV